MTDKFRELLDEYWNVAISQGWDRRAHDDERGSAQVAESNLCHYVATITRERDEARDAGRREGLEEALRLIEAEEELSGKCPLHVIEAMERIGPVENARAAVRTTKRSISAAIRAAMEK